MTSGLDQTEAKGQKMPISRRTFLSAGTLALGARPSFAQKNDSTESPYPPIPAALTLEQVRDLPIYYVVGNPGIPSHGNFGFTSNAGFVITSDGVLVFDTLGTPSLGWALLQEIRKKTDKPVRYVVVSHYHADHIYGLQAFKDHTPAVVIAQTHAVDYTLNEETEAADEHATERLAQRRDALAPWVNEKTRVVPANIRFDEHLTIDSGDHHMKLIYAGPAHSSSDIMMMVEPGGVLFAGDIVQSGRIPFMNSDDVDTENWLKGLAAVGALRPSFVIPGHGHASAAADEAISFTKGYIEFVRAAMQKAVDDWVEFDQAYHDVDWSRYQSVPAFDTNNRGNAFRIYLELQRTQFGNRP